MARLGTIRSQLSIGPRHRAAPSPYSPRWEIRQELQCWVTLLPLAHCLLSWVLGHTWTDRACIAAHGHGKNPNCMISAGRVAADAVASDRRVEQIRFWNVQISKMQISHSMPRHRIPHLPALDTPILPHHHQSQYHSKQTASPRLLNLAHWLFLASYRHPAGTPSHPPSISASAEEPSEPSSLRHLSPLTGRR